MNSRSFVTHQNTFFKYKDFSSIEMAMQTILPQLAEKYIFVVLQADSFLWKFSKKQAKLDPRHLNHQTVKKNYAYV